MILLDWHAKPITLTSELPTIRLHYHKFIFSYWSGLSKTKASWLFCLIIVPFKATVCGRKGDNELSQRIPEADMHTVTEAVTLTWDQRSQAWQYTHGTHMNSQRWIWACQGCPGVWMGGSAEDFEYGLSVTVRQWHHVWLLDNNLFCVICYIYSYTRPCIDKKRGVEDIKQPETK